MGTSASPSGRPSGSQPSLPGRKARSLALLLLLLCGAAGLALWATRSPPAVPTAGSLDSHADPAAPPPARPRDVPLAGAGRPPSSRPATTPDAATDAGEAPATPSATEPPSAPLPRTPVRVIVRQDGQPVEGAHVVLVRLGDVEAVDARTGKRRGVGDSVWDEWTSAPYPDPIRQRFAVGVPDARTHSTSRFGETTIELATGHWRARAYLDDEDVWAIGCSDADVDGEREVTIEVALEPAVRIEGVVIDRDERPVANVRVQAWAASDLRVSRATAAEVTDERGRFSLLGFGGEPHVVAAFGRALSLWDGCTLLDRRPELPLRVGGARVTVVPGALRNVRIIVTRVEPTVIEIHGVRTRGLHAGDFSPDADEPGVWIDLGGVGSYSTDAVPNGVLYVVVPEGSGCPWYVGQCHERAPFVVARKPGGLRVVTLTPARVVSGTLAADPRAGHVRGFLRAPNGDRVEFGVVRVDEGAGEAGVEGAAKPSLRVWKLADAPSEAFDVAAFEEGVRRGPWVEVRAGTDPVEGLVVPIDAPPPSVPAPPADEILPR